MAGLAAAVGVLAVSATLAVGVAAASAATVRSAHAAGAADAAALAAADTASGALIGIPCDAAAQVADDVAWPARIEALRARLRPPSTPPRTVLRLTRDGRTLHRDGAALDLTRRGPLRRVLLALFEARLARPGAPLDTHAVLAAGWPGERMFPESGAARVYMAVRRLRVLGLDASLVTVDGGYALDPRADAAWLDAPDCQPM